MILKVEVGIPQFRRNMAISSKYHELACLGRRDERAFERERAEL